MGISLKLPSGSFYCTVSAGTMCAHNLQSREFCGLEALLLLIVFDHVPFFNFTKMLVGFDESIFCGNSGLETMFIVLKWSSARVYLLGCFVAWRKWLQKSKYYGHLRDNHSQQLFPEVVTIQLKHLVITVVSFLLKITTLSVFELPSMGPVLVNNLMSAFWFSFSLRQQEVIARQFIQNTE